MPPFDQGAGREGGWLPLSGLFPLGGGRPKRPLNRIPPTEIWAERSPTNAVAHHYSDDLSVLSGSGASFERLEFSVNSVSDLAIQ